MRTLRSWTIRFPLSVLLLLPAAVATAAPGDLLRQVAIPVPSGGLGVAVDDAGVLYFSIQRDPTLYRIDASGNLLGSLPTRDASSGDPVVFDEIAWDGFRGVLWGSQENSSGTDVFEIDPATGGSTHKLTDNPATCWASQKSGLSHDDASCDGGFWMTEDTCVGVEHISDGGAYLGKLMVEDGAGGSLRCAGVVAGTGDLLYVEVEDGGRIVEVTKSAGAFIAELVPTATSPVKGAGLECDPFNFFPKLALWRRQTANPPKPGTDVLSAFEVAPGTCTHFHDPLPPDQGNVLRAVKRPADVALDFAGAPATLWRLFRDTDKQALGVTALTPDAPATAFVDPGAIASPPALWLYRVKGLAPCTLRPGP